MYTVLLVDDEADILNSLKNIIDWPVYGIENVLTACDGLDALQRLDEQPVDLLITDINMPNMDGITLFKKVRTSYPHIRCIFLSSYSDFAYAKEAIALGVENYLLKPIKCEELNNSIHKALDNLSMHRDIMWTLFLDNILYRWVTNDISNEELTERSRHIHVNIYFRNYCVVLIKATHQASSDKLLSAFFLQLRETYDAYHFVDYNGYHVIILGGHTIIQDAIHTTLQTTLKQIDYPHDFLVSVGTVSNGSEQVASSYQSAFDSMLLCRTLGGQQIVLAENSTAFNISEYQLNQIANFLKEAAEANSEISTQPLFQELFSQLSDSTLQEINSFINTLAVRLFHLLISLGLIDTQEEESIIINSYHFEEYPSNDDLLKCFNDLLTINLIQIKKHLNRLSPICLLAMQYVSSNFTDHVSIKDFCCKHNANASYFGFLFKKETGIYFNDYISQIRINHAMMLLKNTNYKVSQICKMSGFVNTSYFILCFKKRTGLSPASFKQMLTNSEAK